MSYCGVDFVSRSGLCSAVCNGTLQLTRGDKEDMGNRLSEMERSSVVSFAFVVEHSHSFGSSVRIMGGMTAQLCCGLLFILASLSGKRPGSIPAVAARHGKHLHLEEITFVIQFISFPEIQWDCLPPPSVTRCTRSSKHARDSCEMANDGHGRRQRWLAGDGPAHDDTPSPGFSIFLQRHLATRRSETQLGISCEGATSVRASGACNHQPGGNGRVSTHVSVAEEEIGGACLPSGM